MERTALLHADYLDILFQNRNKNYGGYELRKHYPDRIRKALFTVIFLAGAIGGYQWYATFNKHQMFVTPSLPKTVDLTRLKVDVYIPPTLPPSKIEAPSKVIETVSNPPIKIVTDNTPITAPPKTADDLKGKAIGSNDNPGNGGDQPDLGGKAGIGNGIAGSGESPVAATEPPVRWVEQMPQFSGSLEDYLHSSLRYPEIARESGVQGKVVLEFVVNEEGEAIDVKVRRGIGGGCDEEAMRVVKNMPRWRPGKQNGHPVKVLMTLPIVFSLD